MYRITFDFPNLPKGGEIAIPGLYVENGSGVPQYMLNGSTYDITDEMEASFRALHSMMVGNTEVPGNSLVEMFRHNPHVTVAGGDE